MRISRCGKPTGRRPIGRRRPAGEVGVSATVHRERTPDHGSGAYAEPRSTPLEVTEPIDAWVHDAADALGVGLAEVVGSRNRVHGVTGIAETI
jgi:hypothetical protein